MGRYITEDEGKIKLLKEQMAEGIINTFIEGMTKLGYNLNEIKDILEKKSEKGC